MRPKPPAAAAALLAIGFAASAEANTGTVVSAEGHVLTAHHVVRSCPAAVAGGVAAARVAVDAKADLALLRMAKPAVGFARFRGGANFGEGFRVAVAGFPLRGWTAPHPRIVTGVVTSIGAGGPGAPKGRLDPFIRFTASLVPGDSGGPVLDGAGHLVGLAVAVANLRGAAEGERFSLKLGVAIPHQRLTDFLDAHNVSYRRAPPGPARSDTEIEAMARKFTVRVRCAK